ncbi:hypothetical protein [Beijerinckia sp. L45]|uniref:hypothetical protein n=1 Tax=Beijerinckia sp. L45 TaxID=1641855 RepID=UPI00131D81FB|nr:hypothetical protein [Beijerinckia sp. L45]
MDGMGPPSVGRQARVGEIVSVFAASCTACYRLSRDCDLPLILVGVAVDVRAALRRLNQTRHGSAVRWQRSFQPILLEPGWDDWRAFDLEPDATPQLPDPLGVRFEEGRIVVPLPDGITVAEFREALAGALRHMRFQEAVIRADFLEQRSDADPFADVVLHPRYTPVGGADFRGATLVTDIVVLDPATEAWRLLWLVVAAKLAATEGRWPSWI